MNPQAPESNSQQFPAANMPMPGQAGEQSANFLNAPGGLNGSPEQAQNGTEQAMTQSAGSPMPAPTLQLPPMPSVPAPAATTAQDNVASTTKTVVPNAADDQDLIEKEWVNKAKQIVEKTRNNPYEQSRELTVFKADYMQKRYSKTIKLGE